MGTFGYRATYESKVSMLVHSVELQVIATGERFIQPLLASILINEGDTLRIPCILPCKILNLIGVVYV